LNNDKIFEEIQTSIRAGIFFICTSEDIKAITGIGTALITENENKIK